MLERDRVIVLHSQTFRESDRLITALNSKGQQIKFIAKGALRSKKRFQNGVLDLASFIEVEYRPKPGAFHQLKQAWPLNDFYKLRENYDRLQLTFYFLKVIKIISLEGLSDSSELFHLLGNALLTAEKSSNLHVLKLFFQVKLLFLQGVLPEGACHPDILGKTLDEHHTFKIQDKEERELNSLVTDTLNRYISL